MLVGTKKTSNLNKQQLVDLILTYSWMNKTLTKKELSPAGAYVSFVGKK